jgi:hypothetical protein
VPSLLDQDELSLCPRNSILTFNFGLKILFNMREKDAMKPLKAFFTVFIFSRRFPDLDWQCIVVSGDVPCPLLPSIFLNFNVRRGCSTINVC